MAAFASAPPDPLAPAPDPQDALIQAVQAGDAAAAARWLQRWVHRRGVASLEPLVARVASLQGPEAADWLRRQLETPVLARSTAVEVPPALRVDQVDQLDHVDHAPAEPAPAPEETAPAPEPVLAFEPTHAPPVSADPTPEPVAVAEPEQPAALQFPPLEFELPSFELPPLDPPAAAAPEAPAAEVEVPAASAGDADLPPLPQEWSLDLEAAFPPIGSVTGTIASVQETAAVSDPTAEAEAGQGGGPALPPRRRGAFARMKSMVRGCLEEAREALHRFDAAELEDEEGEEEFLEAEDTTPQPAQPTRTVLPEMPSFLAEGSTAPPSRAPGAAPPAPSPLSDLRGWLPEADEQLPRAS